MVNLIYLNKDLAYTDIVGLYEAIYKKLNRGIPAPDNYVFEPSEIYCSQDIFFRVQDYYREVKGWDTKNDMSFVMCWVNSGPKATDDLRNWVVVVGSNFCHPREEKEEVVEEKPEEDTEERTEDESKELLARLFPGHEDLYEADKADVGYYISDIVVGEPAYYYMESVNGSVPFYMNTQRWYKEADGVAYAVRDPDNITEDNCYQYDDCIPYSFDEIYEMFKDDIDEDWSFAEALQFVLRGQTLEELQEQLQKISIWELKTNLIALDEKH